MAGNCDSFDEFRPRQLHVRSFIKAPGTISKAIFVDLLKALGVVGVVRKTGMQDRQGLGSGTGRNQIAYLVVVVRPTDKRLIGQLYFHLQDILSAFKGYLQENRIDIRGGCRS